MMLRRRFSSRRRMTREDKAKEEMEWRKINEDIELEREGVEPLLDSYFVYSTEVRQRPAETKRNKSMVALAVVASTMAFFRQ